MKDYIEQRVIAIANYIVENDATVRCAARVFGVSKSTVHKDCAERLPLSKMQRMQIVILSPYK